MSVQDVEETRTDRRSTGDPVADFLKGLSREQRSQFEGLISDFDRYIEGALINPSDIQIEFNGNLSGLYQTPVGKKSFRTLFAEHINSILQMERKS